MKTKQITIYIACLAMITGLSACSKKYPGDNYDFSETSDQYIKLKSGQILEINSETVDTFVIDGTDTLEAYYYLPDEEPESLTIETREGFPEIVQYVVELKSDEGSREISGVHSKFSTTSTIEIMVNDDDFGTADQISGTLKLVSTNRENLTIGYPLQGNGVTAQFVANKPYVVHLVEEEEEQ